MKLKELEQYLGHVKGFPDPKFHLEQYATDAHIAGMFIVAWRFYIFDGSKDDVYCS